MTIRLAAADRRQQLLDVAMDVFALRGFHAASMNEIAEAAGVTKPVLYQHFTSKRSLYLELLDEVGSRLRSEITTATAAAPGPYAQVEAGFAAYFRFVANRRSAFTLLFGGGAQRDAELAEAVAGVETAIAEAIAVLIDVDVSPDHRRVLAAGIVGLAEGASRHWVNSGLDLDPDLLARQVASLAWAGLRGIRPL